MRRTNTAKWDEKTKRWKIYVQKDNVRKTFYSSIKGKEGQREANAKADNWLENNIIDTNLKIKIAAEKYMSELRITTSKGHWYQYEYYFKKWIIPKIGNARVEKISEQQLQEIINAAFAGGLSKKSLGNIRSCIKSFMKFCRKSKYTTLFVEDLKIPKNAPVKEKNILNPDEINILFSKDNTILNGKAEYDLYVNAYRFQVLTGLRPGELIGLMKTDIKGNTVFLQRAINVNGEITGGKNENARRQFDLTEAAANVLQEQFKILSEKEIISDFVFPDKYGDPIKERTYRDRWTKYREYNGIKTPVTPYELRHTFVSIVKALPEGHLKQLVGHSKDMDTYGVYSHEFGNDRAAAAAMVQDIFNKIIKE